MWVPAFSRPFPPLLDQIVMMKPESAQTLDDLFPWGSFHETFEDCGAEWSHERHLGASSWLDPMARQKLWMGAWLSGRAADLPDLSKNSDS